MFTTKWQRISLVDSLSTKYKCIWNWLKKRRNRNDIFQDMSYFILLSVQFSCSVLSDFLQPHKLQHTRLPCPSPTPGAYSNSCLLSRWCHPTISSSVVPFASLLQYFPSSVPFPVRQFFPSGGQSIGVSPLASILPMNIRDQFPLGWTGWISLQSKGLSRVFSSTTIQRHLFFSAQLPL